MHILHLQQGLLLRSAKIVSVSRSARSGSLTEEQPAQDPSLSGSATRRGSMAPAAVDAPAAVPASTARTTRCANTCLLCSPCIAMALVPLSCMELELVEAEKKDVMAAGGHLWRLLLLKWRPRRLQLAPPAQHAPHAAARSAHLLLMTTNCEQIQNQNGSLMSADLNTTLALCSPWRRHQQLLLLRRATEGTAQR